MKTDTVCFGCFSDNVMSNVCPYCGFSRDKYESSMYALPLGFELANRYVIGKELGSGGFGITYVAYDTHCNTTVAVKEYLPTSLASRKHSDSSVETFSKDTKKLFLHHLERFIQEAQTIAKYVDETGIVTFQDVLRENGTAYIIMEYVKGITLEHYVKANGGILNYEQALKLMFPVIKSLAHIHKEDLIHRDISPDNIFVSENNQVKLLDFGAARYVMNDVSQSLSVILKHGFAPMEQYSSKGKQGPWTDVYAVSSTLYWMLTGIKPSNSMDRLIEDEVVPINLLNQEVPDYISNAIVKGMSIDPKNRIKTMEELLLCLEGNEITETVLSVEKSTDVFDSRKKSRRIGKVLGFLSCIILASVLLIYNSGGNNDNDDSILTEQNESSGGNKISEEVTTEKLVEETLETKPKAEYIEIVAVREVDNTNEYIVDVEYYVEQEEVLLKVGLDVKQKGSYTMLSEKEIQGGDGSAEVFFEATKPEWGEINELLVYVNLSEINHGSSWSPIASDKLPLFTE